MSPHPLTNFETQKYYPNELRFNGVYSRVNMPKNKGWGICDKSWWICRCLYTLDYSACKKYWNYLFWQFWS